VFLNTLCALSAVFKGIRLLFDAEVHKETSVLTSVVEHAVAGKDA
jgi:hypothetical protein